MKKTLLTAALFASFAGLAQAETAVTLYGLIDTGIGYGNIDTGSSLNKDIDGLETNKSKHSRVGLVNGAQSGSRFGLRGSEELYDGLNAVFVLESGFTLTNGKGNEANGLFTHQAKVGLSSDSWGSFDLGRQTNVASKYFANIDPFRLGFQQSKLGIGIGSTNGVTYDHMALYQTPLFDGFQFGIGYSFNLNNGDGWKTSESDRAFTTGLQYSNGPLAVAFSYDAINLANEKSEGLKNTTPSVYAVGAAYDFDVVKLSLAYGRTVNGWINALKISGMSVQNEPLTPVAVKDGFHANSYMIGFSAPMGMNSNVFTSWQHVSNNGGNFSNDSDAHQPMNVYSLGYVHDLSKKTNFYALGSYISDYYFVDGAESTAINLGVQHRF